MAVEFSFEERLRQLRQEQQQVQGQLRRRGLAGTTRQRRRVRERIQRIRRGARQRQKSGGMT